MPTRNAASAKPIAFFVHHQGRGHAKRCEAILQHLKRPAVILCADPGLFTDLPGSAEVVPLPNMIGAPSRTPALHDAPASPTLYCAPLGVTEVREHMGQIAQTLRERDPALFFIDVSAEIALLSRILSVPAVKVRMHGDRNDPSHVAAYEACVGMVAPFDETIEQADYPAWARAKTFYSGGLCTTTAPVPDKTAARAKLGLDPDREVILTLTGGGGAGTPYAPLTMGCRALPGADWHVIGQTVREGHETDFRNLTEHGWVEDPLTWIAAADVVIASAGDNTVHEVARVGRPFLCVPEWRYFGEQVRKAEALHRAGAAHTLTVWPGGDEGWRAAIQAARALDLDAQRALFAEDAGAKIAGYLDETADRLWAGEAQAALAAE
ncbi:glycosyltransferase [Parvularcula dongshanensis]|uniref:Putative glycosyltransferase n=1 Tax=Parvularcula dongshanensis TaxID=1173995 RepID=A0A840I0V1_9PROT|nr:glycosyltransferase [Parvularcula dongshanensis]MBB4657832.1 putative glycosyltransferase [Parvularcula dongshanensis]